MFVLLFGASGQQAVWRHILVPVCVAVTRQQLRGTLESLTALPSPVQGV